MLNHCVVPSALLTQKGNKIQKGQPRDDHKVKVADELLVLVNMLDRL